MKIAAFVAAALVCGALAGAEAPPALKDVFKDYFVIGAALNPWQVSDSANAEADIVRTHFNTITSENNMKWGNIHPGSSEYAFAQADRFVEFGRKHGMTIIGHTLVWHAQTPRWVFQGEDGKAPTREALLTRMQDHIRTVVGRYKGKVRGWDVVNEALNDDGTLRQSGWLKAIGEDYLAKAFEFARDADPEAELYYNDYGLEGERKREGALALVKKLKAAGVKLTGVGLQGHYDLERPSARQIDETIAAFAKLGLKVMITELDVNVLPTPGPGGADVSRRFAADPKLDPYRDGLPEEVGQRLAQRYAELFGLFLKHRPAVSRVTFWGVSDRSSWLNNFPVRGRTNYPLLFDRNGRPKAALQAVVDAAGTSGGAAFYCDPVAGSAQGDGTSARPWRTLEEVLAAGLVRLCDKNGAPGRPDAPVKPGDTLFLRSGWHGAIVIPRGYNDRPITIAADKGHTPQVGWIEIGEGRKWIVKGLTVSPSLAPRPPERRPDNLVVLGERGGEDSAELVVEDCFVYSALDTSAWTGKDWVEKPAGGIWLGRHGRGHIARNNYVLNTRFAINLCAPECLCEGNVVANFSADGIRATRDGQVVQYNVIKNVFVNDKDGDPNHDDGIQVFLFNVGTGTLRDLQIRGNIIIARERDDLPLPNELQGIGCFDGPLVNFLVEKNVVCVNHWHGITLGDAQGCTIRDNTAFSRWGGKALPWVMLGQKKNLARGNTVRGNRAHSFSFEADAEVTAEDNRLVDETVFRQKLAELAASIDAKFGAVHPAATRPRLEPETKKP
jgi:endo-1,4-beta-xylanase